MKSSLGQYYMCDLQVTLKPPNKSMLRTIDFQGYSKSEWMNIIRPRRLLYFLQYRDSRKPEVETIPYSYQMTSRVIKSTQ